MEFAFVHTADGEKISADACRVRAREKMVEVFRKTAEGAHPFIFVEDDAGEPIGLIAADEILQRAANAHPQELVQWMELPVESGLEHRLHPSSSVTAEPGDGRYIRVTSGGRLIGLMTDHDVLVSWQAIRKAMELSHGDAVTGLPGRAAFDQRLNAELNRSSRTHQSVGVILIDLDYFKQINDQFGHAAGDAALNIVARTLRKSLRSYDMVARFGGDEFAVICSGCRPKEIDIVVRRLRHVVCAVETSSDAGHPVPTISVGAAVVHCVTRATTASQLVKAADECLYAAKGAGRNCAWKCEIGDVWKVCPVPVPDRKAVAAPMAAERCAERPANV